MATNIQSQSQTELKAFLEESLRAQYPSANSQQVESAVEVALGRRGYVLRNQQSNVQRDRQGRDLSTAVASFRDAAISAAQAIPDQFVQLAAVASAYAAFATASVASEQQQQQQRPGSN